MTILSVRQTAKQIPALSEAAIRWLLFNRESNGLAESGSVIKAGRRVLIDYENFVSWLRSDSCSRYDRKEKEGKED